MAAADAISIEIKRLSSALPSEAFGRMMHDLNRQLFEMVHSAGGASTLDKLSALCLIGSPPSPSRTGQVTN